MVWFTGDFRNTQAFAERLVGDALAVDEERGGLTVTSVISRFVLLGVAVRREDVRAAREQLREALAVTARLPSWRSRVLVEGARLAGLEGDPGRTRGRPAGSPRGSPTQRSLGGCSSPATLSRCACATSSRSSTSPPALSSPPKPPAACTRHRRLQRGAPTEARTLDHTGRPQRSPTPPLANTPLA
jgi:hypothetical protein